MGRALSAPEVLVFDPTDPADAAEAVAAMAELAATAGWMNLEPEIPEEDVPPLRGPLSGIFSARGPDIPLATWTPATTGRRPQPASIGVQHPLGAKARPRLAEVGLEVPPGWAVRTDNPRRGLVIELPADAPDATVLDWLVAAGEALNPLPATGRWLAYLHGS